MHVRRRRRRAGAALLALGLIAAGSGCDAAENADSSSGTGSQTSATPLPPSEQVCELLTDDEVTAAVAITAARHAPPAFDPRSCTWDDAAGEPLVQLALESQRWVESQTPNNKGTGAPCGQDANPTETLLGDTAALHASCTVDGVAFFLSARTAAPSNLSNLLRTAASRIGSIDREAFGFGTAAAWYEGPPAPPECLDAWRADRTAPVHCEEYPTAFDAVRNESNGG